MLVPILISGGSGTRLWPVSRKSFPKQFSNYIKLFRLSGKSPNFPEIYQNVLKFSRLYRNHKHCQQYFHTFKKFSKNSVNFWNLSGGLLDFSKDFQTFQKLILRYRPFSVTACKFHLHTITITIIVWPQY